LQRALRRAATSALLALCLPGCTSLAHWLFPCPVQKGSSELTRETPDEAIDFIIDAFENGRAGAIYHSLHPDFIKENGPFTQEEFQLAYEKFEADFAADATSMAAARRVIRDPARGEVVVELTSDDTGAFFPFVLVDRAKIRIVTKNPFIPPIEGDVDMHSLVRMENGRLKLPPEFALTDVRNISPATAAALK